MPRNQRKGAKKNQKSAIPFCCFRNYAVLGKIKTEILTSTWLTHRVVDRANQEKIRRVTWPKPAKLALTRKRASLTPLDGTL